LGEESEKDEGAEGGEGMTYAAGLAGIGQVVKYLGQDGENQTVRSESIMFFRE
jgi:hypothetical protein